MTWDLQFAPLLPEVLVWSIAGLAVLLLAAGLFLRVRGLWLRMPFVLLLVLVLLNPILRQEDREPIPDVVTVVVDESRSQTIGERQDVTDMALEALEGRLARDGGLEVRVTRGGARAEDSTDLFAALKATSADIPPDRLAGAILITDGQIHDVPEDGRIPGFDAPVHALITGRQDERDRKLTVVNAPAFGIVGDTVTIRFRIEDLGPESESKTPRARQARGQAGAGQADVTVRLDGTTLLTQPVPLNEAIEFAVPIDHSGANVLELEVTPADEELTLLNNRVALSINGVRDRLKVLLVSGEPHAGQRTWRNLLKSDPAVDLIHFTILRPPDKQDFTRPDELALIEFPTDELFDKKLHEFDLVIFDRFKRRGVLHPAYLGNVARYVERGGALLTAAGPAYATVNSVHRTPLAAVLPATPTGRVIERGFRPRVTGQGRRHPVTADLPGSGDGADVDPTWGRWFRVIEAAPDRGTVTMTGPDDRPVLVLDRTGEGRVAQFLSDHAWLWARGFESGGPQQELLRRLAHWLMREPELEEEVLSARSMGEKLEIRRRTMADAVPPVTVTSPSGTQTTLTLEEIKPGEWRQTMDTDEIGLFRLESDGLSAVVAVGPLNSQEFSDVRASAEPLAPVAQASGGGRYWIARQGPDSLRLPALRRVRRGRDMAGPRWLGLVDNQRFEVKASREVTLVPPLLLAILLAGTLIIGWRLEAR